jgi:signal peptidase I
MKLASKLPAVAAALAFCLAGIGLLSALQQIAVALFALIPLAAAIGILRRRVWSAYGFALYEAAQMAVVPLLLSRTGNFSARQLSLTMMFYGLLVLLFFLAGRALASAGAVRGWASPWIVLAALGSVPFFFVQAFVIPSGGMDDTLLVGDRILTQVFPSVRPAPGDILVFHYPIDRRQIFVKRVIGVPGDHIRIVNSVVYRNGKALTERYATHKFVSAGSYRDNFPGDPARSLLRPDAPEMPRLRQMFHDDVVNGEVIVPPKRYFVLGDNRDNSLDSRYWGFVDQSDVIGKAILIYDSQAPPVGAEASKRGGKIRWGRMFRWL